MKQLSLFFFISFAVAKAVAQPILSTGGKAMPREWIDSVTGHKVIRLTDRAGENMSFYFHNDPFVGNDMIFYGTDRLPAGEMRTDQKQEIYNSNSRNRQIYKVNLRTQKVEQLTHQQNPMNGEIVGKKRKEVFYQIKDSVFSTHLYTQKTRLVYVFPEGFKGGITTINADNTLIGGVWSSDAEKELLKKNPEKSSYFNVIYEARLPRTLFTINVETGVLQKIYSDSAWLNHVQFSPSDPKLLMFCHEGPWHKVNRIWTIRIDGGIPQLMHQRTMPMEIAGHEWISTDGSMLWYDLQQPRSVKFYVAGVSLNGGNAKKYELTRNEWSIHYNCTQDQKLFCGDGGDSGQVAKALNGRWIYLFHPQEGKFSSEQLVDMRHHNYKLEPNVHFSPDAKWIIFRANFEGTTQVYAVSVKK